jgi:hypothetical protein
MLRDINRASNSSNPDPAAAFFSHRWQGESVGQLFERIRSTMPQQSPHSLGDEVYLDIVAFLLHANGLSSGNVTLQNDPQRLKAIIVSTTTNLQ